MEEHDMYQSAQKPHWVKAVLLAATTLLVTAAATIAMPPHPDLLEKQAAGEVTLSDAVTNSELKHERGIDTGDDDVLRRVLQQRAAERMANGASQSPEATTFRILALLVDFDDKSSSVAPAFFDTLVFGATGSTVRTFYDEFSNSQIDLVTVSTEEPSDLGWLRAPETYSYYVGSDHGMGAYPTNSQGMVEDVVDLANGSVDFSNYDNDGDNYVDVLLVIHAGSGAEYSGSASDMWSHKWGLNTPKVVDGVYVQTFTVQPEYWATPGDMTIGVYAHELGHGLGLPDLYDVDYTSQGVGKWCLMSGGSWNGYLGNSPAHPSAWCLKELGVVTPTEVSSNLINQSIAARENGGPVFKLTPYGAAADEYFLIENRQAIGTDAALPGSGLLIWHVHESAPSHYGSNRYEWYPGLSPSNHFVVALEQADGLFELDKTSGQTYAASDAGDPFPGTSNRTTFGFGDTLSAAAYGNDSVSVFVTNISPSGVTMTADFVVDIALDVGEDDEITLPTRVSLAQNYPNPFNPSTVITFTLSQQADVTLEVFNVLGQSVATLVDDELSAGEHSVSWDGLSNTGTEVASGVFFYRLTADNSTREVRKMVLVR
ncbi:M6 family metalloprotease domain-containing protein [candidate division GN15 bacterium]|nr:M6 family metalloprotease domain-containing protein [candidate division GN15 bacterium]